MAYPHVDPTPLTPISAAATEFSFAASAVDCAENDYIVVWLSNSATSGTISEKTTSAWSLTTLNVTSGHRMALAYLKVGASAPSDVIFQANSGLWQGAYAVYRDADTTTFNAGTITTADAGATVITAATGALTPSSDNAHVVYFAAWRNLNGIATPARFLSSEIVGEVLQTNDDGTTFQGIAVGTWQQTTAAATSKTLYVEKTADGGSKVGSIVLAIKNKASGKIGKHGVGGVTKAAWLGYYGKYHDSLTWAAPDTATINGIVVATAHTTTVEESVVGPALYGTFTSIASNLNTTGNWVGRKATFAAPVNMSGKILSIELFALNQLGLQYGTEGAIIKFTDGTNWVAFQLVSLMNWVAQKLYTQAIDLENATPYDDSGTPIDWTAITAFELHTHRVGSSGSLRTVAYRNILLLSKSTLTGGNSAKPLDITYLDKVLNGWGYVGLCDKQGPSISLKSDVQIGDGSMPTYFDSSATMLSCEGAYSALSQRAVNIPVNKIDITIKAASGDTIYDRASATSCGQLQNYSFDAASHADAFYSLSGKTFVGVTPTLLAGETFTSATFSGCGPVATKGANLTNCTITDTLATSSQAAVTVDGSGSVLDGCTIDVTGTAAGYHLELGTAVTAITLTDQTFTGTPGTDKVHVLKTSGTVTITISGTTTLAAGDVTTEGATVAIDAPTPTLDATVLSGSRVVLYNDTTAAELDNTAPAGTSWSKVITSGASSGDTLTLHVFKEGYEEFSTSFIYAGIDNTLLVSQAVHAAISSLRTELSITDYTTITEFALDITGTVEIDADDADGNTTKARLAIWYNGVLTTENGARYLRGAITILSTAAFRINTSILDLKIENVSVTYGLNFTDIERRLYRDDGAAIYAPASAPGSIQNDYSGVPDTVTTSDQALNLATAEQAIDNKLSSISSGVWAYVVTGSTTAVQMMRGFAAMLLGKVSGAGTGAETFRDIADTKDVATFTVDSSGNRTAVTRDLT